MYIPLQRITGPFCHRFVSFANLGFPHNTILEIEVNLWKKKTKANIFENFICQQVSMGKKSADKQRSSRQKRQKTRPRYKYPEIF